MNIVETALDRFISKLRCTVFAGHAWPEAGITAAVTMDNVSSVQSVAASLAATRAFLSRPPPHITLNSLKVNARSLLASLPTRILVMIARHLESDEPFEKGRLAVISYRHTCSEIFRVMRASEIIWDRTVSETVLSTQFRSTVDIDSRLVRMMVALTPDNVDHLLPVLHQNVHQIETIRLKFEPNWRFYRSSEISHGRSETFHSRSEIFHDRRVVVRLMPMSYARNDFMDIGDYQTRGIVAPAPHLKFLTIDLGYLWSNDFDAKASGSHKILFSDDSSVPWNLQIPRRLFVAGTVSLESLMLRGIAWPADDIQRLVFGKLRRFGYEGPACLNERDLDSMMATAPSLRWLTLHIHGFEAAIYSNESTSAVSELLHLSDQHSCTQINGINLSVTRDGDSMSLMSYFFSRGASDVVVKVEDHPACKTVQRLAPGATSVSAGVGGYSVQYPSLDTIDTLSTRRVRFTSCYIEQATSQFLASAPQRLHISSVTTLSLHEYVVTELLRDRPLIQRDPYSGDLYPIAESVVDMRHLSSLRSVKKLTIWLASCGQHNRLHATLVSWQPCGFTGIFATINSAELIFRSFSSSSSTSANRFNELFAGLQSLVFSVGPERRSRTVPLRARHEICIDPNLRMYDSEFGSHQEVSPSPRVCACDNLPTVALRDVRDFLVRCRLTGLRQLGIYGLTLVDVDAASEIIEVQRMGLEIDLQQEGAECDVCSITSVADTLDAKDVFDALEGW